MKKMLFDPKYSPQPHVNVNTGEYCIGVSRACSWDIELHALPTVCAAIAIPSYKHFTPRTNMMSTCKGLDERH